MTISRATEPEIAAVAREEGMLTLREDGVVKIEPESPASRRCSVSQHEFDFSEVLRRMVEARASDVHITAGFPPAIRDKGKIQPMDGFAVLTGQQTREVVYSILNDDQRKRFENSKQLDFAYAIPGVARFRVNCFFQRGSVSDVFRLVPQEIPALDTLGVPQVLRDLTAKPRAASSW